MNMQRSGKPACFIIGQGSLHVSKQVFRNTSAVFLDLYNVYKRIGFAGGVIFPGLMHPDG
jgi:hypothetical protein